MRQRLYSLDAARGLAALCVVFVHWNTFFFEGPSLVGFVPEMQPLYGWLAVIYSHGWMAVDLFFVLSGFVFYWLYAHQIASRSVTWRQFFALRFARLYPLHFATLLLVLWLQKQVLPLEVGIAINDHYHFLLQLLLASQWGLEWGHSYNSPIWSVSIEVALYIAFFILVRWFPVNAIFLTLVAASGLLLMKWNWWIGRGVFAFFIGGTVQLVYAWMLTRERKSIRAAILALSGFVLAVCGALFVGLVQASTEIVVALVFAPTILLLALLEPSTSGLWRRLAPLGDMSYSVYLLHFPLMLIVISFNPDKAVFYSPWALAAFLAGLLVLSWLSHRFFEMPAQRAIRSRMLGITPLRADSTAKHRAGPTGRAG